MEEVNFLRFSFPHFHHFPFTKKHYKLSSHKALLFLKFISITVRKQKMSSQETSNCFSLFLHFYPPLKSQTIYTGKWNISTLIIQTDNFSQYLQAFQST